MAPQSQHQRSHSLNPNWALEVGFKLGDTESNNRLVAATGDIISRNNAMTILSHFKQSITPAKEALTEVTKALTDTECSVQERGEIFKNSIPGVDKFFLEMTLISQTLKHKLIPGDATPREDLEQEVRHLYYDDKRNEGIFVQFYKTMKVLASRYEESGELKKEENDLRYLRADMSDMVDLHRLNNYLEISLMFIEQSIEKIEESRSI